MKNGIINLGIIALFLFAEKSDSLPVVIFMNGFGNPDLN